MAGFAREDSALQLFSASRKFCGRNSKAHDITAKFVHQPKDASQYGRHYQGVKSVTAKAIRDEWIANGSLRTLRPSTSPRILGQFRLSNYPLFENNRLPKAWLPKLQVHALRQFWSKVLNILNIELLPRANNCRKNLRNRTSFQRRTSCERPSNYQSSKHRDSIDEWMNLYI